MNSALMATISYHAFQPALSFRFTMCFRLRRIPSSLRRFSSHVANQPCQPRESSRLMKYAIALPMAPAPRPLPVATSHA